MAKQRKAWVSSPVSKSKSSLPGTVKDELETKASNTQSAQRGAGERVQHGFGAE